MIELFTLSKINIEKDSELKEIAFSILIFDPLKKFISSKFYHHPTFRLQPLVVKVRDQQ